MVLQFTVWIITCRLVYFCIMTFSVYIAYLGLYFVEGFRNFWGSITGFCKLGETILAITQWQTFFNKLRCHQQDKHNCAGILLFYLLFPYSHTFSHERRVVWWSLLGAFEDASFVFPVDSSAHQFFNADFWCLLTNSSTVATAE